jgi:hypothetical protein
VGNEGTACHSRPSGTSPTIAPRPVGDVLTGRPGADNVVLLIAHDGLPPVASSGGGRHGLLRAATDRLVPGSWRVHSAPALLVNGALVLSVLLACAREDMPVYRQQDLVYFVHGLDARGTKECTRFGPDQRCSFSGKAHEGRTRFARNPMHVPECLSFAIFLLLLACAPGDHIPFSAASPAR